MNVIIRTLVLFQLVLVGLSAAPWLFVKPVLKNPERMPFLPNIETISENNRKVLVFQNDSRPELEEIRGLLNQSKMIEFVHSLRKQARAKHLEIYGEYNSPDQVDTPYVVLSGDTFGKSGPAVSSLRLYVKESEIRTNSLLILAPMGLSDGEISFDDFVSENYLAPLIAHEMFHGIMGDVYGERMLEMKSRSLSNKGHRADLVTDEYLAFIEGIAEAMELATLELFPNEINHQLVNREDWSAEKRRLFTQVKYRRLVAAQHNHLGLVNDGHQKDGQVDSADDLFKTEGVIATLIYNLLFKSNLENPFDKLLQVMVAHKPMTFFDFINAFVDEFPEVKNQVIRQFLESTRYVTISHEASEFYKQKYLMHKQYKQKKVSYQDYKNFAMQWAIERSRLLSKVLDGELALNHAITPVYGIKDDMSFFEFNINTASNEDLYGFFSAYFSEWMSRQERSIRVGKLLKLIEDKKFIRCKEDLPFSKYVNDSVQEYNDNYNEYYDSIIQQRFQQILEYSSWSSETSDPSKLIDLYKLHN